MARRIDPRAEPLSVPPNAEKPKVAPISRVDPSTPPEAPTVEDAAPRVDPRIALVEKALASGDWKLITKELGPLEDAAHLPPNLGLINAVAHIESASGQAPAPEAHVLAIRSMASIFGVTPESRLAIVFAKRLTRRHYVSFRERPAPPPRVSFIIIALTLVITLALGWLLTSGAVRLTVHF